MYWRSKDEDNREVSQWWQLVTPELTKLHRTATYIRQLTTKYHCTILCLFHLLCYSVELAANSVAQLTDRANPSIARNKCIKWH